MDESTELFPIGQEFGDKTESERNTVIRREIAIQSRKKFESKYQGEYKDRVAATLHEKAEQPGTLLIFFSVDSEGQEHVAVADEKETQRYSEWLASEETSEIIVRSSQRKKGKTKQSIGVQELDKKRGHPKKSKENGGGYASRFNEYTYLKIDNNPQRLQVAQIIVDNLIRGILRESGTIIVTPKNIEVIDSYGKGVKCARGDESYQLDSKPFKYFVDSASYCPPKKE